MKRLHFFKILLPILCACIPVLVQADAAQDARRDFQARYDQFDRSYMNKEFKRIAEIFTPTCVMKLKSEGRTMSAIRVVKGMEGVSKSLTVSHAKTRILSVKPIEKGYEVTALWTGDSNYVPANGSKEDPPRHSRVKQNYRDTWKKTDKGWQIAHRIIEEADDEAKPEPKK